jgi:hypothetical protein
LLYSIVFIGKLLLDNTFLIGDLILEGIFHVNFEWDERPRPSWDLAENYLALPVISSTFLLDPKLKIWEPDIRLINFIMF